MSKYYVTTAIDYVNAKPHVGHAVEKIQADVLARWHRQKEETYFLSGADENSLKNVQAAEKQNMPVADFVDQNAQYFSDLKEILNLSYDQFIRTSDKKHFAGAQKFWETFDKDDIYQKKYKGLYCVGCEEFKMEKDLVDGKCPDHQTVPEEVEEENYFFRLSKYQDQLLDLIRTDKVKITPEYRKNEILSFTESGLQDFSISRSAKRAMNWGVPVPGDSEQIMYVWVDALSNYITALDYSTDEVLYKKFWQDSESEKVHVVGKGILRFHAIYWIAMLLSAKLALPNKILCHEYLTINGKKISKSLGNVIDPAEVVAKYGTDSARYVLLVSLPYNSDGDISWEKMDERYQADLSNNLGNLFNRTVSMIKRYNVSPAVKEPQKCEINDKLEALDCAGSLNEIISFADSQNKFIAEKEPWILAKEGKVEELADVLSTVYSNLKVIADLLAAFMPETAGKMKKQLETLEPEVLFPRLGV